MKSMEMEGFYCLLFWYSGERIFSTQSTTTIAKPRKEANEYKCGDFVIAKFGGSFFKSVVVECKQNEKEIEKTIEKLLTLLNNKTFSNKEVMLKLGITQIPQEVNQPDDAELANIEAFVSGCQRGDGDEESEDHAAALSQDSSNCDCPQGQECPNLIQLKKLKENLEKSCSTRYNKENLPEIKTNKIRKALHNAVAYANRDKKEIVKKQKVKKVQSL